MLMPNLALIGAQKMGLTFLDALDKEAGVSSELIVLSDGLCTLNELETVPAYKVLKKKHFGISAKLDSLLCIVRLRQEIKRSKPDVVVSIAPIMNIYILLALSFFDSKSKPKVILEEHQHLSQSLQYDNGSHVFVMKIFYKYFLRLYQTADILKVVSIDSKLDFITNWGIEKKKVFVLNPPINIARLNALADEKMPEVVDRLIKNDDKVIFSLGRLESQKNFSLLIDGFYLARQKDSKLKLVIVGSGSELETLKSQVDRLGIKESVLLTGYVKNPFPIFKRAKLFCLTSIWEGMPVSIMESMSLGCPVVSVNCKSGPSEMITNGENGLLVDSDAKSISTAIMSVIDDQKLLSEMKLNCLKLSRRWDHYSYCKFFLEFIHSILK
jgi:glycosyltransferase involved in cell wall biosynthesis